MRKVLYRFGFGLLFLSLLPLLLAFLSYGIASAAGCGIEAGGVVQCRILGLDLGETLGIGLMLHWFGLITLPFAALALLLILLLALVDLIRYLRR
jgi:hypothetical protein